MGVVSSWLGRGAGERRAATSGLTSPADWLVSLLGGGPTASGKTVTEGSALTLSAVFQAVRLLSMSVGMLPLPVFRVTEQGKERQRGHELDRLLNRQPNRWQTAIEFRSMMQGHLCLRGNAYARIILSNGGRVLEMIPLHPDRVRVWILPDDTPGYTYQPRGGGVEIALSREEMFHLRGFGGDGYVGYSVVTLAREALGLAMATEEYQARFYANNASPSGVLTHPGKLSKEAKDRLRSAWEARFSGSSNAHRVAVLEEGMRWEQLGLTNADQQFIESRNFSVTEVARWFGVPPHKLGDLTRATFSNIEHQGLEFLREGLQPWLEVWEQAIWRDLLGPGEQRSLYVEHNADAFLRGDTLSRYRAHAIGRQNGWLSADDIREKENMNPLPDGQGQVYLVPANMLPADQLDDDPEDPEGASDGGKRKPGDGGQPTTAGDGTPQPGRAVRSGAERPGAVLIDAQLAGEAMARAFVPALADVHARASRREAGEVERAERRGVPSVSGDELRRWWAETVYREHGLFVARALEPLATSLALAVRPDVDPAQVAEEARRFAAAAGEREARSGARARAGDPPEAGNWAENEARRLVAHFRGWTPPASAPSTNPAQEVA